jgi:tetratricopeptide (TPR) repeat protein
MLIAERISKLVIGLLTWLLLYSPATVPAQSVGSAVPHISSGPGATAHLGEAFEFLNQNRYHEAAQEFRDALALDPRLTLRARFPLAVCLFALGNQQEARKEFAAVRKVVGDTPEVTYYLGRLDLMAERYSSAVEQLRIAAKHPPFPDTDYFLGFAYLRIHQLAQAEVSLQKASASTPDDFRVQEQLGILYRLAGRKEEAQKAFDRAAQLRQRDLVGNQEALACIQALQSQPWAQAYIVCQKLFHPNRLGDLVSLGTIYGDRGDYAEALEPFRRAAQLDPGSYEAQYNLGLTYFRLKRYAEAREPLMKAVALRPDVFKLNALLGAVLFELGDDAQAYQFLSHANELNPHNQTTANLLFKEDLLLARQHFLKRQYQASIRYLAQAAAIQPGSPDPHRLLSTAYAAMGNLAGAQREALKADRLATSP